LLESRLSDGQVASERLQQIDAIRLALEKEVVAQRLADYGLSAEQILAKLPTMSDEQLHQLASMSDTLGEGGDGLGAIVAILLIVLLVIVILKVSDKQIIIR
jgi:ribose 1,5-bisphosphokinase PhnN